jgi:hypothetical protein
VESLLAKAFDSRDLDPEQAMQARGWFSNLATILGDFLRRDVSPDELAARDVDSFLAEVLGSCDIDPEQAMQARGRFSNVETILEGSSAAMSPLKISPPAMTVWTTSSPKSLTLTIWTRAGSAGPR